MNMDSGGRGRRLRTRRGRRVLLVLLAAQRPVSSYDIWKLSGGLAGNVERDLHYLEAVRWVSGALDINHEGRPPRKLYVLTYDGRSRAATRLGLEYAGQSVP